MFTQIVAFIRKFSRAEEGAVAIYMTVLIVALLGMAGLAVDVGSAYFKRQQMQTAADAAAISGEIALQKTQNVNQEGQAVAGSFDGLGISGATVTINCNNTAAFTNCAGTVTAPIYSDTAAYPSAVEAIITKPQTVYFGKAVGASDLNIFVRAVAVVPHVNDCILALNPTGIGITLKGNISIGNPNCGIAANSSSNPATDFKGASATIDGYFTLDGHMNSNGNNSTFLQGYTQDTGVPLVDPYVANGEKAWVMAQIQSPNLATGLAKIISNVQMPSGTSAAPANQNKCTSISSGTFTGPAANPYCTVSGTAQLTSTTGSFNIGTLAASAKLTGTAAHPNYINTMSSGATLSGSGAYTFSIGTVSSGVTLTGSGNYYISTLSSGATLDSGTYNINNLSTNTTLGTGTYYINTLPTGVTLSPVTTGTYYIQNVASGVALDSGTYYIDTVSSGVTLGSGTYYLKTVSSGVTLGSGTYYLPIIPSGVTLSGTGTYYIGTVSAGVTLGTGTYYIDTMTGGTLSGGGTYHINTVTGGTFQNGVYYINNIINVAGPVTTTNATLVVFGNVDMGNQNLSLGAPVANLGTATNAGLALVSPSNTTSIDFGGNGAWVGAVYAPNTAAPGSKVYMRGTVNASCAQVIAGVVNIAGNVSLGSDSSCGIQNIIQNGISAVLVQ